MTFVEVNYKMEYKKNDSPEPEDSKVSNDVASGTSIRTHYPWIPVNSDEVKKIKLFFNNIKIQAFKF